MELTKIGYRGQIFKNLPHATQKILLAGQQKAMIVFQTSVTARMVTLGSDSAGAGILRAHLLSSTTRIMNIVNMIHGEIESVCLVTKAQIEIESPPNENSSLEEKIAFLQKLQIQLTGFRHIFAKPYKHILKKEMLSDDELYLSSSLHLLNRLDVELSKTINTLKFQNNIQYIKSFAPKYVLAYGICVFIILKTGLYLPKGYMFLSSD